MGLSLTQHLIALGLVMLDVVLRGLRITRMLPVPLLRAMVVNTCGDALAAVTPARAGGEPLRFVAFERDSSAGAVLAAFVTETGVDAVLIVAVTVVIVALKGGHWTRLTGALSSLHLAGWWWVAAAGGCLVAVAPWIRRRWAAVSRSVREGWHILLNRPWRVLASVSGLTLLSMAARTAILPVLAGHLPGLSLAGVVAGSFALVFVQSILPTPAGAGPVELGFVAGFAGAIDHQQLLTLLLAWRIYTIGLGGLVGGLLMWGAARKALVGSPVSAD